MVQTVGIMSLSEMPNCPDV
uniref:Uncharacterized protein n=1 Tax=Anguilla anguilla TaxID=7936 RepID=A0A0E9PNW7_ANGAN